jgi:hypothetical protein
MNKYRPDIKTPTEEIIYTTPTRIKAPTEEIKKKVMDKMANKYGMHGDEINYDYDEYEKHIVEETIDAVLKEVKKVI